MSIRSKDLELYDKDSHQIIEENITKPNGDIVKKRYIKGRLLGKGGFATVHEFSCIDNKKVSAGKIVSKNYLQKTRARQKLMFEIKIHRSLHHTSIVSFERFFEDNENLYILLEICSNQTMNELMRRRKRLSELEIQCYLAQIISALKYLHSHRIIHRDIKLGNLFLSDKMEIKLGDFGLATKLEFEGERKRTICGTPNYIAPEILDGKHGHSYEVDIWSLGVLLYTLCIGKPPFETLDIKLTYKKIRMTAYAFPEQIKISDELKDLISRLLVSDPLARLTLDEILHHPFMGRNPIPKLIPSSSLAVPLSGSFLKQYQVSLVTDKMRNSNHSQKGSLTARMSDDLRSTASKEEDKSSVDLSKDSTARESSSSLSTTRKIAIMSLYIPIDTGTRIWVKKWVDYSTKYGIGYSLSNGHTGVYFNDSSKIICDDNGMFLYIYRKPDCKDEITEKYSLMSFPVDLKKKITLLEHFRKHLVVDKIMDNGDEAVYLKKWLLTEHAVIFRLSNKVVQIRFADKSELLLSNNTKTVVYINKTGSQEIHPLKMAITSENPELNKRLNYTTEMISRMLSSQSDRK
ncbi:hypothetical protein SteCoe_11045 [Stentor coeruleus]|uniref:Serine/threonine-protein kinase PLK n=1 Tax=Stentor coeruleus TaxID=5963 RepID=A0A1R2CE38_9CILI|nr:hypothetical protein SteCoe_11045 [Stentor coeruleus]